MSTSGKPGRASGLLAEIMAAKQAEVVERRGRVAERELLEQSRRRLPRPFFQALLPSGRGIIAELKRKSPSRGVLREDYRPARLAAGYEAAGARALSVLTDGPYFGGSLYHLGEAREATGLPVLRKDFIIDEYQVAEAAAAGADAILLIVAALDDGQLRLLFSRAMELGLDALVEVHGEEELERAAALGARLIGVNNRDLATLEVSIETSLRLAPRLRPGTLAVSESGLRSRADLDRLEAAGYRAFLIGESFLAAPDPAAALRQMLDQC
jgi:indole-3-glycerol phosphate synthase